MAIFNTVYGGTWFPWEYQKVEWIASSWTQYIDTWITLSWKLLTTKCKFRALTSNQANYCWVMYSGWSYCYQMYTPNWTVLFYWLNWWDNNKITSPTTSIWSVNTDIETTITQTWYLTWTAANLNFTLFARNANNSIEKWSLRIYYWQMIIDGDLTRDFVPCYRKSDGVIWLYDLVGKQFYTNSWSWTFTKWSDV